MSPSRRDDRAVRVTRIAALTGAAGIAAALVEHFALRAVRHRDTQHLYLSAILEQTPTPVYLKTIDGRYEATSPAFERQHRERPARARSRFWEAVDPPASSRPASPRFNCRSRPGHGLRRSAPGPGPERARCR